MNNNQTNDKIAKKNTQLILVIVLTLVLIIGGTFAYFSFSTSNNTTINGDAGTVNLNLTVTKILPNTTGIDDILIINFNELASSLNGGCASSDGEFALCQLYKVTITNNSTGINTNLKGSVSFNNTNTPNLSWVSVNNYSASTTYTSALLGNTFNTATSTFATFVDNHLLTVGQTSNFYLLVFVNETEDVQTDIGSYGGTVRFEDSNGKGVTSTFSSST